MTALKRAYPAAALVASVLLTLPLAAGASGSSSVKGITADDEIEAIAMDGPLVAYDVSNRSSRARCNRLYAWNVKTGARKQLSGKGTCDADSTSTGAGVAEIAVAGVQVAWIVNEGGNEESIDWLYKSSSRQPRERKLAEAGRYGDVDGVLTGGWLGGLVGSGTLLAVNRWSTDKLGKVNGVKLQRIGRRLTKIASGSGTMRAASADSGRIAVLRSDGRVGLYSQDGALLRTFTPAPARAIALRKTLLVVLTMANELEIYRTGTGSRVRTWPVKGRWTKPGYIGSEARLDVHGGVAVYSTYHTVHAVRLSTGRDVVLVKAKKGRRIEGGLEIESPGVVYGPEEYDPKKRAIIGRVVFIPMGEVLAAVS